MRKRKLPNRRRRTVRYGLLLAAVVALASAGRFYCFLPSQAAAAAADEQNVEHGRVVVRADAPDLAPGQGRRLYLTQGDGAMLLCVVGFGPGSGWSSGIYAAAGTWDGSGLYAGVLQSANTERTYLFGRVDDPAVTALTVRAGTADGGTWTRGLMPSWRERDGVRYFVEPLDGAPLAENGAGGYEVSDAAGGRTVKVRQEYCWY